MGVAERYEQIKKQNSAKKTAQSGVESRYKANNAANIAKDIQSRLTKLGKDTQSLLDGYNSRFFDKDGKYITDVYRSSEDAGNWLYDVETRREALETEGSEIKKLLADYGEYFDKDMAANINSILDGNGKVINGIVSDSLMDKEYWDKFEDENAWKEAVQAQKEYADMSTADLGSLKSEIDELEKLQGMYNRTDAESRIHGTPNAETRWNMISGERAIAGNATPNNPFGNTPSGVKQALDSVGKPKDEVEDQKESLSKLGWNYINPSEYSPETIGEVIAEKRAYYNHAEYIQNGIKMASVTDPESDLYDPEFELYAQKGKELGGGKPWEFFGTYLGDNEVEDVRSYFEDGEMSSGRSNRHNMILAMNEEEVSIYNYYLGKYGKEKAESYLSYLESTLNARYANHLHGEIDSKIESLFFASVVGLDQFATGMRDLVNTSDSYIPTSPYQQASAMVGEDMAEAGWGWKAAYDLISTTSNMAPSIITSAALSYVNPVLGQVAGSALIGASASGNAYAEAINLGYTKEQARGYSLLVGGSEAGLQYLLGGIGSLGGAATKGLTAKTATKLASNFDRAFAKIAVTSGVKLVGGMVSEFGEEYLQEILNPVFKNIALGTNEDFKLYTPEALYAGFLGALSAGLLEGGSTISGEISTYKAGKDVIAAKQTDSLAKLGLSYSADTVAYKIASQVNENTDAYTLGQLLREVGADHLSAENIADITAELTNRGMALNNAQSIAKWLNKAVEGEYFTERQISALENNEIISEVFRDVIINENSSVNQRVQGLKNINDAVKKGKPTATADIDVDTNEKTASSQSNFVPLSAEQIETVAKVYEAMGMPYEQAKSMAVAQFSDSTIKVTSSEQNATEGKFEVSDDGKTVNTKTGDAVEVVNISGISDSGEVDLTLKDGTVVKASDISFGNPAEAAFVGYISELKLGKNAISAETANDLYQAAMSALRPNPDMTVSEASSLIRGLAEAYTYGAYSFGEERLTETDENGKAKRFAGELTDTQRRFAYEHGKKDRAAKVESEQKAITEAKGKAKPSKKHPGKIVFENGINVNESDLSDFQKANLEGIKLLAEISSIEFHIYQTEKVNGKWQYTMADGTVVGANGWYVAGTNEIWVDLNAGEFGEGAMIRTAAHEISHYIKEKSPKQWQAMADLLMQTFAENDVDVESMLNRQIAKIKRRYKASKDAVPSQSVLREMAYEELVSDALSDMLTDGSIVNFIAEVKAKDQSLRKRILEAIRNLLKKWGLVVDSYKGKDLDTDEAKALSQFEDTFKKLQEMYREALMDADATYSAMHSLNAEQLNTLTEAGIGVDEVTGEVFSIRDSFATNDKITIGKKSFDIEAVATLVSEVTGRSIEDARKWVNSEMTVANLVMKNPEFLDFEADDRYEAIKKNSDYPQGTVDLSNLCPKRQEFTSMFDMLQRKYPNKLFTAEDVAEMRNILSENGLTVACGACFVEDRRQLLGEIADTYINMWKDAVETGKPLQKTNAEGKKIKLTVTSALAKQYGVTKGSDILATDTYIPTQYDLTTYEGFRLLEKNHPTIAMGFNRYNNSRGQQSGRLIEGRAEYKRQILGWSDAKVRSVNNNGGLRIFSFSDFEVVHLLDLVQVIIDCSAKGVKIQGYTKSPAFAKLVRNTGIKLNRSFIPKGDTGIKVVDGKRVLDIDAVEGIDYNDENFLDEADNPDVGNVIIGINPEQIGIAFLDNNIDYIIPFHSNKAKAILKALGLETWVNYKESQHEKDISTGKASKHNVNIYTQVINKYHPTNKVEFVEAFLKECKRQGKIPRYSEFLNVDANGDYAYREGYHKLLVDFKMFDKDGNILPQGNITPNLDNAFMTEILNAEVDKKANYEFPKEVYDQIEEKFGGKTMLSERDFSYDELIAKDDLQGVVIDKTQHPKIVNGIIDNAWVVKKVREKCETLTEKGRTVYYTNVPDIGTNVEITAKSLTHGFTRPADRKNNQSKPNAITNARVTLAIPQILKNSIEVNRSQRGTNIDVPYTHVLIGTVALENSNGVLEYYAVRSMVQERKNQEPILVEADILGKLTSVNAKKIGSPTTQVGGNTVALVDGEAYTYKIADLLNDVKGIFDNTFSKDVYQHFGMTQKVDDFSQYLLFSDRDSAYLDAVSRGDTETEERMIYEAAKSAGYPTKVMHGTRRFGFTKADVSKSDDKISFFATDSLETAGTYSQNAGVRRISTKDSKDYAQNLDKVAKNISGNIKELVSYCNNLVREQVITEQEFTEYIDNIVAELKGDISKQDSYSALDERIFDLSQEMVERYYTKNPSKAKTLERFEESKEAAGIWDEISVFNDAILKEIDSFNIGGTSGVYELFANTDGHLIVECNGSMWDKIKTKDLPSKLSLNGLKYIAHGGIKYWTTRSVAQYAKDHGYPGVTFKNVVDSGNGVAIKPSTVYIFFDPQAQVKSADPVTYDDKGNVIPLSERFDKNNDDIRRSERDSSTSTRSLLANALEGAVQNDIERKKLNEYKEKIALLDSEQQKLAAIQKQLFTKGAVDPATRKKLQLEAKQISNRINIYDRQLLNLEATKALKNVLEREKTRARKRQKEIDNMILQGQKDKAAAKQRELMDRYKESRRKATESRHRTAMRHKIKNVVSELNQLLLKGSKERNVKLGLQSAVASALDAINMDTVAADERIAKLEQELKKAKTPEKMQEISRKIENIRAQGDKMASKLEALKKAYEKIKTNSEDAPDYFKAEAGIIEERIASVIDIVGDTPLRNMSLYQLEAVHDLYSMVLATVRNANSVFLQGKLEDLQQNATATMEEISAVKTLSEERIGMGWLRSFSWNEMVPIYAFRRMGSKTFEKFFWEAIKGQNTVARDLEEANNFAKETRSKYNYNKWDLDKVHEFKLADGRTFRVTLRHMMSIYAYSKREQALDHMAKGGFFFNDKATFRKKGGVINLIKSNEVGYSVDLNTLQSIANEMTSEQLQYVDEMQDYLTQMGRKGNEVSRVLWGIDIFKEKVYFPLKSVKDFIFQTNQTVQESSLKNDGMTKETKPHASNPIVLEAFDDVWASHVNRMSQYHGLVLPIENLNKIHSYGTWASSDSVSVSTMLRARFGEAVNDYINQFIKDLNGASSTSGASNPFFGLVGKFKKTAVAASMSVVAQQPTAILRAMAVMDTKYFIGLPEARLLKTKWNEVKKHAPIAIIKEIGGFDAGAGRQATEWLNSDTLKGLDKVSNTIDDVTMKGAAIGDQVGWCTIWEAVKREIKATTDLKVGSDEFLSAVGERFTEIIVLTQVYDSTLSRSGFMRSKHDSVKMLTSFMGEPTVSFNMLYDATIQAKRKTITKRKAGRIVGSVYASVIAASIAASLIYALRDDDEDESYAEKFAEAFGDKLLDDINPLNMLPGVRDIVSIFDGWDVERTDMAIFKDIKDAIDGLSSDNKSAWKKVEDFAGAIASGFGVPLKNLLRTGREFYNVFENIFDGISPSGVDDAFVKGITGEKKDKGKALYDAIVNGDDARVEVYRKGYKDEKAYETTLRKALRENDPRIKEAAEARFNGDFDEYESLFEEIESEGNFEFDTIKSAISTEFNKLDTDDEETVEEDVDKVESIYSTSDMNAAFESGDTSSALAIIDDLVRIKTENYIADGETEKDAKTKAQASVKASMTAYWKPLYIAAYHNKDNEEMKRIRIILLSSGLYGRANDVVKTGMSWIKSSKK